MQYSKLCKSLLPSIPSEERQSEGVITLSRSSCISPVLVRFYSEIRVGSVTTKDYYLSVSIDIYELESMSRLKF